MSKTILIVGDYELMRKSLSEWLQHEFPGCRVMDTTQGEAAVTMAQAISPDLVLIDTGWFSLEGLESARLLKAALPMALLVFVSVQGCGSYRDDPTAARASVYALTRNLRTEFLPTISRLLALEEDQGSKNHTVN